MVEETAYLGLPSAIEPQLKQLHQKMETLNATLPELDQINHNLSVFNRNFAKYMQGLMLYSKTVEFPEAPNDATLELLTRPKTPPTPELPEDDSLHTETQDSMNADAELDESQMFFNSPSPQEERVQKNSDAANMQKSRAPGSNSINSSLINRRKKLVFNPRKLIDTLPSKYRIQPHKSIIESILKDLFHEPEGIYMHDIMRATGGVLSKSKLTEYLNVLVKHEIILRISKKGFVYVLNPDANF